jgi:hypothetical protein
MNETVRKGKGKKEVKEKSQEEKIKQVHEGTTQKKGPKVREKHCAECVGPGERNKTKGKKKS